MINLIIQGKIQPKQRARSGQGFSYTPAPTVSYENLIKVIYNKNYPGSRPISTAIEVCIKAFFNRPKSHYGTGKNAGKLKASAPEYCVVNKDVDNIAKIVLDALNKIAYVDDKQVVSLTVSKQYAEDNNERLWVVIFEKE